MQNLSFGAANDPKSFPVCKVWYEVLSWLTKDETEGGLGWDKTKGGSWSALDDWKPAEQRGCTMPQHDGMGTRECC